MHTFYKKFEKLRDEASIQHKAQAPSKPSVVKIKMPGLSAQLSDAVLGSLAFSGMDYRQDQVAEAHTQTFEWVFDYALGGTHCLKITNPGSHKDK